MPTPTQLVEKPEVGKKRIRLTLMASPLLILAGAFVGYLMHEPLSRMHPTVSLSEQIAQEDAGTRSGENLDTDTFRTSNVTTEELHADAMAVRETFKTGGAWLGAFIMLIVSLKLVGLSVVKKREIFTPHKETCFSCGRCYPYCPVEEEEEMELGTRVA